MRRQLDTPHMSEHAFDRVEARSRKAATSATSWAHASDDQRHVMKLDHDERVGQAEDGQLDGQALLPNS